MTSTTFEKPLGRRALAAVALAVVFLAFLACLTGIRDHDSFHHLALGREIVRGGFPRTEPFLFPMAGIPAGVPNYWLGSVIFFIAHRLLGDAGPTLLIGAVGALVFLVLFLDAAADRKLTLPGLVIPLVPLVLALGLFRLRAVPRPEIFATLFLALTAWAVRRHAAGRSGTLLLFPALALLWNNVHPSLLAGLALVALYVAIGLLLLGARRVLGRTPPGTPAPRQVAIAAAIALGGLLAGFASPSPQGPLVSALRFAMSSLRVSAPLATGAASDPLLHLRHWVAELQPIRLADLSQPAGMLAAAMALVVALSFALAWRRASLRELAAVILFAALAISARRFTVHAAVIAAPVAARNLAAPMERLWRWLARPAARWAALGGAAALLAAAGAGAAFAPGVPFGLALVAEGFPARAVDHLAAMGFRGRLFNTFHLGGYLEWRLGMPVYQDGRGWVWPGEEEAALVGPGAYPRFQPLDEKYHFDALVVGYPNFGDGETDDVLRGVPGMDWGADRRTWALVAFDDGGMLYLRRDGAYAAEASRDEYRFAMPANPLTSDRFADPRWAAGFLGDMERSVAAAPSCRLCRVYLGIAYVMSGRSADAERVLVPALGGPPLTERFALDMLARTAAERGDLAAARRHYRSALRIASDRPAVRSMAAEIELAAGNAREAAELLEANVREGRAGPDEVLLAADLAARLGNRARAEELRRQASGVASFARAAGLAREAAADAMKGDQAAAVAGYRASLALEERNAAVHSNLGYLYYDQGDLDAAMREQRRALELDSSLAEASYGLGMILADRGEGTAAAKAFRDYLRLEPRGFWSKKAEEKLKVLEGH